MCPDLCKESLNCQSSPTQTCAATLSALSYIADVPGQTNIKMLSDISNTAPITRLRVMKLRQTRNFRRLAPQPELVDVQCAETLRSQRALSDTRM